VRRVEERRVARIAWILAPLIVVIVTLASALRPIGPAAFASGAGAVEFVDRAGLPLGTVLARDTEHAVHVPLRAVSARVLAALVAVEDARFRRHHGVDAVALTRAAVEFAQRGHAVSGGSTITMQLARLRYGIPRTLWGKLRESVLAMRIERGLTKDQILEAYVNRIPMGGNLVGIEAGARTYFGVPASDLDWAQATLLAALPNDPVALDPYAHPAALERRRRAIVAYLRAHGVMSAADARQAAAERLAIVARSEGIGDAPQLQFRLAASTPDGVERVRTTLDRDLQRYVENTAQQVVASLRARAVRDAAVIVIDNATGDVLAYVGSPAYFDAASLGRNDGVVALRQPGSTLKPFLYELAFERRAIRPATILHDVPTTYAIPGARIYAPADYSGRFEGPVRPRIALADSLNVPAVRTLSAVGVATFQSRLNALGFAHLDHPAAYYGLGLTLGSGEVTLEELGRAYALIARGGRPLHLRYRDGDAPNRAATPLRVGDEPTWALITDMLSDAHARGRAFGVASLLRLPFPSAVKTGTSSDFRDTWTVGFTRTYTVATWVGNFDGSPMQNITGVTGAAPLWNRIMLHLGETREPGPFAPPRGYQRRAICATTGALPDRACESVVSEWLDAADRRALRPAPAAVAAAGIDSPRDGAIYRPGGRIVLRTGAAFGAHVRWRVNGTPAGEGPAVPLALRRGSYTITAASDRARATAHVLVADGPPAVRRAGFTVSR
jgi:penicillin-binding protein 1C